MSDYPHPDEIRQRMNSLRSSLDFDVEQVASSVREKTDWRYYVRSHPWLCLTAATAVGFLLVPRKEKRIVADADALANLARKEQLYVSQQADMKSKGSSWANQLFAFALAAGSRTAVNYVSNLLSQSMEKKKPSEQGEEPLQTYAGSRPK